MAHGAEHRPPKSLMIWRWRRDEWWWKMMQSINLTTATTTLPITVYITYSIRGGELIVFACCPAHVPMTTIPSCFVLGSNTVTLTDTVAPGPRYTLPERAFTNAGITCWDFFYLYKHTKYITELVILFIKKKWYKQTTLWQCNFFQTVSRLSTTASGRVQHRAALRSAVLLIDAFLLLFNWSEAAAVRTPYTDGDR
jgi:hypothetical protein